VAEDHDASLGWRERLEGVPQRLAALVVGLLVAFGLGLGGVGTRMRNLFAICGRCRAKKA